MPVLSSFNNLLMSKQYAINEKDFNVCVLFRLGFVLSPLCLNYINTSCNLLIISTLQRS